MKTVVGLAAASCALLVVLTGCGGGPAYSATAQHSSPTAGEKARAAGPVSRSGDRRELGDGLTIAVSAPKSFVPTASTGSGTPRALGFEMTVENNGTGSYRPTLLSLSAEVNGVVSRQVIDSTQGYTGVVGAADVPPGRSVRFSVAFAVPAEKAAVLVSAQPDPATPTTVTVFSAMA